MSTLSRNMDEASAGEENGGGVNNLPAVIPMNELEKMANAIVKSNLFGVKTVDQAVTLMLVAQAEGLHPATAARDYHVIQGRPALKADAMLARFQNAGGRVDWEEYTDAKVSGRFSHPQSPKPILIEWTIEMAKRIGLAGKDNWKNYPRAMLRARVISEGVRTCYPAIATGIYTPEEVQDFEEKDITPRGGVTAGALSALPIKEQEMVIETATKVKALLAEDNAADAYALWQNSRFDADQQVSFWSLLDSKQRGVLDRMGMAERAAERGTISEPQKKRLDALIKEFKCDRAAAKEYCKREFEVEHFQDLTPEQYKLLDAAIANGEIPAKTNAAAGNPTASPKQAPPPVIDATPSAETISEAQESAILDLLELHGKSIKQFTDRAKIKRILDLPTKHFQAATDWIKGEAK